MFLYLCSSVAIIALTNGVSVTSYPNKNSYHSCVNRQQSCSHLSINASILALQKAAFLFNATSTKQIDFQNYKIDTFLDQYGYLPE